MYTTARQEPTAPAIIFPRAVDGHWETQIRTTWNEQERTAQQEELIYEVSQS